MGNRDLRDDGYERWRNSLQGVGAVVGVVMSLLNGGATLILMVIGAIYGTMIAGLGYQLREILRDDGATAAPLFSGYLGAAAGFTYFFFLSGTDCGIERLLFSPLYAALGWMIGAALGFAAAAGITAARGPAA